MKWIGIVLVVTFYFSNLKAQEQKKTLEAARISTLPKIDGLLTDEFWKTVPEATGFTQNTPDPGKPSVKDSRVKIAYDNHAVYIGARLIDVSRDSVFKDLSVRDDEGNADAFAVIFDTYGTGLNAFGFGVTPAGVQFDSYFTPNGMDDNWDAVWESAVNITDEGWTVELKIPYSALRFPKTSQQNWSVNFYRKIRRVREESYWNYIDPKVDGYVHQFGKLEGISGIISPIRLSLTPYISASAERAPSGENGITELSYALRGGMDLKYGLSQSFTMDMTLIPDFGQVESDNHVLNLSPFEVRFDEKRSFFTEGTELFNKAGLFYSRRVGGRPLNFFRVYGELNPGESVITNPSETQLINATKISGRTKDNLGIGFFNALSAETYARIMMKDGDERRLMTQPLSNYNILVFDQSLKNNSFFSLINTNVTRSGSAYDANVTGTQWRLRNKKNTYGINGSGALSQKYGSSLDKPENGYTYYVSAGKTTGNLQYSVSTNVESDTYDPNDLGFLSNNNERTYNSSLRYNSYKPIRNILNKFFNAGISYSRLFNPDKFQYFSVWADGGIVLKSYDAFGFSVEAMPASNFDYFEPRSPGRYYQYPDNYNLGGWISSDYRKRFALDINTNYRYYTLKEQSRFNLTFSPRFRVNDKLSFIYAYNLSHWPNDVGFVNKTAGDSIFFGYRLLNTTVNTLTGKFIFNNLMSLSLKLRHYWSWAEYDEFAFLASDGTLEYSDYMKNHDVNFNSFNIDLGWSWRFAPGSEMSIVWKNAIFSFGDQVVRSFGKNIEHTLNEPQINNISLKVLYYIDYQQVQQLLKK
jgi:hypothetical protein